MSFAWKVLIPLSFANLVLIAIVLFYDWPLWVMTALSLPILLGIVIAVRRRRGVRGRPRTVRILRRSAGEIGRPFSDLANQPPNPVPGEGQAGD
jgi:hypothetical protein